MKKLWLLLAFLIMFTLSACNSDNNNGKFGATTKEAYDATLDGLSEENRQIRLTADKLLFEKHSDIDLTDFKISINTSDIDGNLKHNIYYTLLFYGYETSDTFTVILNEDLSLSHIRDFDMEYSEYLNTVTQEQVEAAKEKLDQEMIAKGDTPTRYYVLIDEKDGGLYLQHAEIVDTPDGTGSCRDHKHVFYKKIICTKST